MKRVKAISISDRKGMRKKNIDAVTLVENFGLENDAHGGKWHRQVSLLAEESIEFMRKKGLDVVAGNFAENITTEGIDLCSLTVGTHLRIGITELIISQLGKVCHHPCAIYHQAGDCVMPREGIFGVVIKGGKIAVGDEIEVLEARSSSVAIIGTAESEKDYGEQLCELVNHKWHPGFIRFDRLKPKEDNLHTILDDLINTQKVDRVILFDTSGKHALAFAGKSENGPVILHYCKTLDDIETI
ncbi:MOSC domain-containing protein [Desulfopila aestuarii]|uniref:MOSC domain-containing protein YiiM n=1 Tax=Desulfopila aestuarii DSM 18488 TaxID=1121416 RepID=A0A1M7YI70_9BACT|nr:MOSC domain-containing protein [Desulfopila aestuarii]SHO52208.1 MOSC domain-containing protein YiiM [Desulfopila aestuarii DSM 18488]